MVILKAPLHSRLIPPGKIEFKETVLPFISSILYILSFPNFNFSIFAWVALGPLAYFTLHSSPRQAFLGGWLAGTLAYSGILYWIVVTFQAAHLSLVFALGCLLLLSAYLGLYWAAWAWFLAKFASDPRKQTLPLSLGAAAWVALEYLRTYLFSGFPWALLGDSQYRNLPIAQIASVTSVYGVSFLAVMTGLALAKGRWKPLLATAAILTAVFAFGQHRLRQANDVRFTHPLKVALLQGNIDQYKKWDKAYVDEIERTYETLNSQAQSQNPDLILWPETSVPGFLLQDAPLRQWLEKVIRINHASHLIGSPVMHGEAAYNSAFSIDPQGILGGEYAKHHLVPFGEVVPMAKVLGRWIRVLNDLGGFSAGQGSSVLQSAGLPVGVNICYEAIFPNLVRQSVKEGAQVIANLTNDGWYMRTAAPYQHLIPNIFRAIENDRWVLRADNTGVSAIIDPRGRVQSASPIFETAVVQGAVEPRTSRTFYTRYGDVFAWACCFFCAFIYLRGILRPR